jgi:2-methylcitrate dehydratase PrpD
MTIAQDLAARVNAVTFDDFSDEVLHWAKIGISDSIGVSLACCQEPTAKIPMKVLGAAQQAGPSSIWGSFQRTTALDAALINATSTHALDFDDCSNTMTGHSSTVLVPGAVAIGEELDVSGRDLI